MSVDLEKATTRNLLDGLRAFMNSFDQQLEHAHSEDGQAITESGEHVARAIQFSSLLPRLQAYGWITLLAVIIEARLAVFCKVAHEEFDVPFEPDDSPYDFLETVRVFVTTHLDAEPPEELWSWITDVATVRDCIALHGGRVSALPDPERRAFKHLTRHRPGLEIVPDDLLFTPLPHASYDVDHVLVIRREFCLEAVTAALGLFGYLYPHRVPASR